MTLSYEHYFAGSGYVSLAAFYKQLESYVYPENVLFDFTGFTTNSPGDDPAINLGIANTPQNGQGRLHPRLGIHRVDPGRSDLGWARRFRRVAQCVVHRQRHPTAEHPRIGAAGLSETVINTIIYFERRRL